MDVSTDLITSLLRYLDDPVSLDRELVQDGEGVTLYDLVARDYESDTPQQDSFEVRELRRILEGELSKYVTHRNRLVIQSFWGLNGQEKLTLEQVAKEHNITRERVRQINAKFLQKAKRRFAEAGITSVSDLL